MDLDETYYYRISKPEGYAFQRLYDAAGTRDNTLTLTDGDLVLIKDGYHPVVAAHGYDVYYLNVLAGSARSMAASDDPRYTHLRKLGLERDPRVPLVPLLGRNEVRSSGYVARRACSGKSAEDRLIGVALVSG